MQLPTIHKGPELTALLQADPDYALRYEGCLGDIEEAKSVEALKHCSSYGNSWSSYMKEWNSYHGMLQRSGKKNIPLSPELRQFPAFLVHVGPKPHYSEQGKLSIDKTNSKGYLVDAIRWEGPAQQTHNRSSSKFHVYKGGYCTDIQLAQALTNLTGKAVKAETVKKRRQRGMSTASQFAKEGVEYESGEGPESDWSFPLVVADKFNALYRGYHRKGETRIAFFIRWLSTKEIPRLDSIMFSDALSSGEKADLFRTRTKANIALHEARAELKALEAARDRAIFADAIYPGKSWGD